ncbi:noncanonical pyrimidine nucleotidase, YjjG family [Rudanella paleaurantiibacter]|uniref:Noncanonical pyrimidine nucleotidase, YjjG family n=1 Tax=Rudanella paleaurantiibacter TaxID=2614655 RepID=A0A7J5U716_9BACT|nr:YjjG family noncanonical pyrimidine nucleotidase [Rudanella paleaurantiibacter]KAB7732940.1 noncanonical pyrimidine nucleotidase, YjjG family [Rudanella paleaurantiibacter]
MYKHLFFDLDHTLWDFDRNSAESIAELYERHRLHELGIESVDQFSDAFIRINRQLWRSFDLNELTHSYIREHRFPLVFQELGVSDTSCCAELNMGYLSLLPRKAHLTEAARDLLDYLHDRYEMHIITNGFDEIQAVKLASSEIAHYFTHVVTNEKAGGYKKPDSRIFEYALRVARADVAESLMIGDNYEADIRGAQTVGLDTVFYNPKGEVVDVVPTHDIRHWRELMEIL